MTMRAAAASFDVGLTGTGSRLQRALLAATLAVGLVALYMAFVYAPKEATMGDVQRIFYFHVGAAWTACLAFFVVFLGGLAYLRTRDRRWDALALSSAEIGVVFTTITLATGSIWAKPAWGTWWTWDPRLTTTTVLWLIYVSYLILRGAIDEPERRASFAAAVGIVGFVDVPIVFLSIRLWRTIHPVLVKSQGFDMEPPMVHALLAALLACTLLYAYLLLVRTSLERRRLEVEAARQALGFRQG
jgi:heme exporter protein C